MQPESGPSRKRDRLEKRERNQLQKRAIAASVECDFANATELLTRLVREFPDNIRFVNRLEESLSFDGRLMERLRALDGDNPRTRLFVMGCARSGTWLLQLLMGYFEDAYTLKREAHFGAFACLDSVARIHVVKRLGTSYVYASEIPEQIALLYIVRHPFDVLSSTHLGVDNYVTVERWMAETKAVKSVMERERKRLHVVRYEDLVCRPDEVQREIAGKFGLASRVRFSNFPNGIEIPPIVEQGMGGLRKPDRESIGRREQHAQFAAKHMIELAPARDLLRFLGRSFNYEDLADM